MSIRYQKLSQTECLDEIDYIRGIYWVMNWDNMPDFTYVIVNRNENPADNNNRTLRNIQIFDLLQTPSKVNDKFVYYGWQITLNHETTDNLKTYSKNQITIINPTYDDTLNKKENTLYKYCDSLNKLNERNIWIEVRYN